MLGTINALYPEIHGIRFKELSADKQKAFVSSHEFKGTTARATMIMAQRAISDKWLDGSIIHVKGTHERAMETTFGELGKEFPAFHPCPMM